MKKKITLLTQEQKDAMRPWAERWIKIGLSTARADRPRAEAAYRACYRAANIDDSVTIIWVPSPIVGALAAPLAASIICGVTKEKNNSAVRSSVDSAVQSSVYGAVSSSVRSSVRSSVHSAVSSSVHSAVSSSVHSAVSSSVQSSVYSAISSSVDSAVHSAVSSSVQSSVYGAVSSSVSSSVDSAVHSSVDSAVQGSVYGAVSSSIRSAVSSAVHSSVSSSVDSAVRSAVRSSVQSAVDSAVQNSVYSAVSSSVDSASTKLFWHYWLGGALWSAWAAYESFFREICGLQLSDDLGRAARAYSDTCESAGYWWPNKHFIMACERPVRISLDETGRLHNETTSAIEWPDGWGIYSWRGITIPREWIEEKNTLTAKTALKWKNIEQRRAACEIIGWNNVLGDQSLNPRIIDEDEPHIGTLIEVDLPDAPASRFIKYRCATGRWFAESVNDKSFDTALKANAGGNGWRGEGDPMSFIPFIRT